MATDNETSSALTSKPVPRWRAGLSGLRRPSVMIAVIALGLLGWQWWETRTRLESMEAELARRLGEDDALAKEGRTLAKQAQDQLQSLTAKVGGLDARLADMQGQQEALDAMYQDLTRSRDERLLAEVEQGVSLAAQELAIAGNVNAALIALQGVDTRLQRAGLPQFVPLRKLVLRDIDQLKRLPQADVPGISLKLEGIIASIDTMPLAHEQRPKVEPLPRPGRSPTELGFWQGLVSDIWNEAKQMIRVERMDRPAPALLSPTQAFVLRENLKLRLINARLSLLQRDGRGFREDVNQARDWLDTYFDGRASTVQSGVATLKNLAGVEVAQDLPTLSETLAAVRNLRLSRERETPLPAARRKG